MALIPGNWLDEPAQSNEGVLAWQAAANATGLTTSTDWAADGARSLRFAATGDLSPQVRPITRPTKAAAGWADGTVFEARFTVYATRVTNVRLILNYKDAAGTNLAGAQFSQVIGATVAEQPVELSQALTIPAGTEQIEMVVFFNGRQWGAGDQFYVDEVFLGVPVPVDAPPSVTVPDYHAQAGEVVVLTATGSADVAVWHWDVSEEWAGEPVTLAGADTAAVTFVAPRSVTGHAAPQALSLIVTVTDSAGQSATATAVVEVDSAPHVLMRTGGSLTRVPRYVHLNGALTWAGRPL